MRLISIFAGLILSLLLFQKSLTAQTVGIEQETVTFSGYVKSLGTALTNKDFKDPLYDNLLHNRLEFNLYPTEDLSFHLAGRNRLLYGERVKLFSDKDRNYGKFMNAQDDLLDLSETWVNQNYWVLHSEVDRLYANWSPGDWQIRLGRQRINWGKTLVWNPNDLFNTYSFYDFDYRARPGADALLVKYYRDYNASVELAAAPGDSFQSSIGALYYSFHQWEYDFQILSGYFQDNLMTGFGWSGYLGNASFRGEMNYYYPLSEESNSGYLLAAISGEYTFKNSFSIQLEGLYNGNEGRTSIYQLMNSRGLEANNLSLFKYGVFGQAGYPVHPLVEARIGSIYYPEQSVAFLMPSISYSIQENWELYALAQIFMGQTQNLLPDESRRSPQQGLNQINLLGLRVKWAF